MDCLEVFIKMSRQLMYENGYGLWSFPYIKMHARYTSPAASLCGAQGKIIKWIAMTKYKF